ncbi:hypothetical protein ACFJIW_18785 [Tahibacter sp. UC22_41]|uniref:hypothetical protein n=1 Tax=Tahibacter sp. UC22_41 TaxID=3350178 RepID=UPI0036D99DFB
MPRSVAARGQRPEVRRQRRARRFADGDAPVLQHEVARARETGRRGLRRERRLQFGGVADGSGELQPVDAVGEAPGTGVAAVPIQFQPPALIAGQRFAVPAAQQLAVLREQAQLPGHGDTVAARIQQLHADRSRAVGGRVERRVQSRFEFVVFVHDRGVRAGRSQQQTERDEARR